MTPTSIPSSCCLHSFHFAAWQPLTSQVVQQQRIHLPVQETRESLGFNPWVGKIPWRRKWQPLQYSWVENSMDRGTWQATVRGVTKSHTQRSNWAQTHITIRLPFITLFHSPRWSFHNFSLLSSNKSSTLMSFLAAQYSSPISLFGSQTTLNPSTTFISSILKIYPDSNHFSYLSNLMP